MRQWFIRFPEFEIPIHLGKTPLLRIELRVILKK